MSKLTSLESATKYDDTIASSRILAPVLGAARSYDRSEYYDVKADADSEVLFRL